MEVEGRHSFISNIHYMMPYNVYSAASLSDFRPRISSQINIGGLLIFDRTTARLIQRITGVKQLVSY